jgi:hypothetical protein
VKSAASFTSGVAAATEPPGVVWWEVVTGATTIVTWGRALTAGPALPLVTSKATAVAASTPAAASAPVRRRARRRPTPWAISTERALRVAAREGGSGWGRCWANQCRS